MEIRRAGEADIPQLDRLLLQVLTVHHEGRPDLFKGNCKKYTDDELKLLLRDEKRPVFAAFDKSGQMLGYVFCKLEDYSRDNVNTDRRTLYIDDLCVDAPARGKHVGTALYRYAADYARENGCYNITLHAWTCNPGAQAFYTALGMRPFMTGMEEILDKDRK